jgi:hypothetical protein
MTHPACPSEQQLLEFVDGDMPPETLDRMREHMAACQRCLAQERTLRTLMEDIHSPVAGELDVSAHARVVLARLQLQRSPSNPPRKWGLLAGAIPLAAGVLLLIYVGLTRTPDGATFQARGGPVAQPSLSRDVGVQLYAGIAPPRPLDKGARVSADTPVLVGIRNLSNRPVFLLLFAVDAKNEVHWIAPAYTTTSEDPAAVRTPTAPQERLLATTVVFDDLAPGPLRFVSLVTHTPHHVSEIEGLPTTELANDRLARRFPEAAVQELTVYVQGAERPLP